VRPALALLMAAWASTAACGASARGREPPQMPRRPAADPIAVAVTVDDLPVHGPTPPGVDRLAMTERLLAAFAAHRLPPVHGFANGKRVDDDPATEAVLRRWVAAGHQLGNPRGRTHRSTPPPSTPTWPTCDGARTSSRGWRRARPGRCSVIRSCSRATRSRNGTSDAIDALLTAFEAEGARWVGLRVALADPFYAPATHAPVPFGSALPYVLAGERGLKVDPPVWARGLETRLSAVCR
jgi:hypothetical protein